MTEVPQASPLADPDLTLIQAIGAGDKAALSELYARHGQGILAYLIGQLGGDHQLAEEVLQDVLLAVWKGAGSFRGESKVRTWMLGIARYQALSARRRRKPTPAELGDYIPTDEDGPQRVQARNEQRETVRAAMRELPEEQQDALELIFFHDLSGPEAADVLGIAPGTVKSRVHRAKNTLRGLLKREEVDS